MVEGLLEFDDWLDKCPVCKEIVTIEEWPRPFADISPNKDPPACPICGSEEDLKYNWITVPTKVQRGFTHNMILWCDSCGSGTHHNGWDAVTGQPKLAQVYPPELNLEDFRNRAIANADDPEALAQIKEEMDKALTIRAFFRPRNFMCLDDGWEAMGHGVRPLERTDMMNRFYTWTNKEAVGEAGSKDNPLKKKKKGSKRTRTRTRR